VVDANWLSPLTLSSGVSTAPPSTSSQTKRGGRSDRLSEERPPAPSGAQHDETQVLSWPAAAENKLSQPIAKTIIDLFYQLKLRMPETN
jgi:hypothetical protein